ncbi:MAG: 3-keto-5-aminohexanoate cleavage enzyme [uncultured bacterium]|nr:MAG: 3-keto-5-aminohexanoate cleavage enzyme [uncultured bacterium]
MISWALQKGGHVRIGLEDNIYSQKGILAKGNEELVRITLDLAKKYNRNLATRSQSKEILCQESESS